MRRRAILSLATLAFATACADREPTAPLRAPAARPSFTVAPTADRTFTYVANTGSDNVSVIRTSDRTVVATIPVGDAPHGVAISPSAGRVYVANGLSNNVSVIRTSDNTVTATIPVGHNPQDVVVAPDGSRVYVTNSTDATVSVIRTSDNTVAATISAFPFTGATELRAGAIAITPDGLRLYVTNSSLAFGFPVGGTSVIRTSDYTVLNAPGPGFGQFSVDVAITPDGSRAYVANIGFPGSVSVLQTSDLAQLPSIALPTSGAAGAVAITPNGAYAYVARRPDIFNCGALWAVRTSDNTIVATVPDICGAAQVATTPDGAQAYVTATGTGAGNVVVVRTSDNAIVGSTAVGSSPDGVAIAFVPSPSQQVVGLQDLVSSMDIASGVQVSLQVKLTSALTAIQGGKTRSACGSLQDFGSQVMAQSGKKITTADAAQLNNGANQVRDGIGC